METTSNNQSPIDDQCLLAPECLSDNEVRIVKLAREVQKSMFLRILDFSPAVLASCDRVDPRQSLLV